MPDTDDTEPAGQPWPPVSDDDAPDDELDAVADTDELGEPVDELDDGPP